MNRTETPIVFLVPVYNEEHNLPLLKAQYAALWEELDAMVVFVDDGSSDGTRAVLTDMAAADERIGYISLSRNFGKEQALAAGFSTLPAGHAVVVMDGDGQHTPDATRKLLERFVADPGVDLVFGVRESRSYQSRADRLFSKLFYALLNTMAPQKVDGRLGDFLIASPRIVEEFKKFRDGRIFWKGIYSWVGFDKALVPVEIADRASGSTKFDFSRKASLAFNSFIWTSFAPLYLITYVGLIISVVSFAFAVYLLIEFLFKGVVTPGYYTLAVVQSMVSGVILLSLGVIARYLSMNIENSSSRPSFVIDSLNTLPRAMADE